MPPGMYHFKERRSSSDSLSLPEIEIIPVNIIKYLAEFQMKAVQFLYEKRDFCVLNDDSGFGKLATVVAYLAAVAVNKTTIIVYKTNEKHLQGWQFHLDLLSNLRPVEVTCPEDFENKSHNVFVVKFGLLSAFKDIHKKFDILIVDNREQMLKEPLFAAQLSRVVDGTQTIIVSSVDITSCTVMVYNVLKLGRRLNPNCTFYAFSHKYKLPDTERSSFDLEDYFIRREVLGRLCGDFRLRRVRYDYRDQVPLVEPKTSALSLYFWFTQPRNKLATVATITDVQVIAPPLINKNMSTHDDPLPQNGSKTPECENECLDETESMPRLFFISDSEDEAETQIAAAEHADEIEDIKENLPSENDLQVGTIQITSSNKDKPEVKTKKRNLTRGRPKSEASEKKEERLTVKTEILVPDENESDVIIVEPTPEPRPALKQFPPPPVQSKRARGRPFKTACKKTLAKARTFTATRGMERMTRASSRNNKFMKFEIKMEADRKKRYKKERPGKAPPKRPEPRSPAHGESRIAIETKTRSPTRAQQRTTPDTQPRRTPETKSRYPTHAEPRTAIETKPRSPTRGQQRTSSDGEIRTAIETKSRSPIRGQQRTIPEIKSRTSTNAQPRTAIETKARSPAHAQKITSPDTKPRTPTKKRVTRASGDKALQSPLKTDRRNRRKTVPAETVAPTPAPERERPQAPMQKSAPPKSSQISIMSTSEYEDIQCGQRLTAESNSDSSVQLIFPPPSPIFSIPPVLSALHNTQEVIELTDSSQSSEQSRRTKKFKKQRVTQPTSQKAPKEMRASPDLFSSSDFSGEKSILNLVQKCMHNNNNNNKPPELSETPSVIEASPSPTPQQAKSSQRTNNGNKITRYLKPSAGPCKTPTEAINKKPTARRSPKSAQHNETTLTRWLNYDPPSKGPAASTGERGSPDKQTEREKRPMKRRRLTLV